MVVEGAAEPSFPCPRCGKVNRMEALIGSRDPRPGDLGVCWSCHALYELQADGFRLLTRAERRRALRNHPELVQALQAVMEATTVDEAHAMAARATHPEVAPRVDAGLAPGGVVARICDRGGRVLLSELFFDGEDRAAVWAFTRRAAASLSRAQWAAALLAVYDGNSGELWAVDEMADLAEVAAPARVAATCPACGRVNVFEELAPDLSPRDPDRTRVICPNCLTIFALRADGSSRSLTAAEAARMETDPGWWMLRETMRKAPRGDDPA